MYTLLFVVVVVAGGGSCNNGAMDTSNDSTDGNKKDENEMLDWRIYPTSVKATSKDPLDLNNVGSVDISGISGPNAEISGSSQQFLSRTEREDVDLGAPVSRDQLYRDLLKDRRREIHVEDFLWTGSGKLINHIFTTLRTSLGNS